MTREEGHMATIKDVAKEANVSIGTVSNVINGTYLIGVVVENLENAETGLILEALERRLENE